MRPNRSCVRRVIAAAALLASALPVAAQARDLPPDGWSAIDIDQAADPGPPPRARGDAPFADTPDWQNDLRVQVGGLAAGDLDGDGLPDLVLVCYQSQSFPPYTDWRNFIYFNTGEGLDTKAGWISDDQRHSADAAIADIDGDGWNDLVVANGGSGYAPNAIYFGSATGLETTPSWLDAQPAWTTSLRLVDIDGDGDLDLVTANQGSGTLDPHRPIYLFRNDGGTLSQGAVWQSAQASIQNTIAVGDLDGDGEPDIGAAKWVNFESALYRNQEGTPAVEPFWTSGNSGSERGIAFADMDGDGRLDVVLGVGNTLRILRNEGDGSFIEVWTAAQTASHQDLLVADFNQDGRPDIVDIDFSTGRAYLYLNTDTLPDPVPVWSYDAPASGTALAAADFDGDGWLDLAIGYSGQPSAVIFFNRLGQQDHDLIFRNGFEDEIGAADTH